MRLQKTFFKGELGEFQIYFRKILLHQQNFWWFRFFLIRLGYQKFQKMSKMKLLSSKMKVFFKGELGEFQVYFSF